MAQFNELYERIAIDKIFLANNNLPVPKCQNMYQFVISVLAGCEVVNSKDDLLKMYNSENQSKLVEYLSVVLQRSKVDMNLLLTIMEELVKEKFDPFYKYDNNFAYAKFLSLSCLYNKIDGIFAILTVPYGVNCKTITDYLNHYNIKNSYYRLMDLIVENKLYNLIENFNEIVSRCNDFKLLDEALSKMRDCVKSFISEQLELYFQYTVTGNHPNSLFYAFLFNGDYDLLHKSIKLGSIHAYNYLSQSKFGYRDLVLIDRFRKAESEIVYVNVSVDINNLYDNKLFRDKFSKLYEVQICNEEKYKALLLQYESLLASVKSNELEVKQKMDVLENDINISHSSWSEKFKKKSDECAEWKQTYEKYKEACNEYKKICNELGKKSNKWEQKCGEMLADYNITKEILADYNVMKEKSEASDKWEHSSNEYEELQKKYKESVTEYDTLQEKYEKYLNEQNIHMTKMNADLLEFQQKNNSLQDELNQKNETIIKLTKSIKKLAGAD